MAQYYKFTALEFAQETITFIALAGRYYSQPTSRRDVSLTAQYERITNDLV